ncbi:hypothetical protein HanRHA438_Chr14g0659011 [Helianthus annuus]|nr:hypothetical protein HanIR_Chr14g0703441 [Helianthus annuus]KAJ0854116.1 hypothetical protein HanRHA438_Chr14g0659011 [Helianthus annuus]
MQVYEYTCRMSNDTTNQGSSLTKKMFLKYQKENITRLCIQFLSSTTRMIMYSMSMKIKGTNIQGGHILTGHSS